MKINRYRKVNRILKYYANHFGFRKPYQVLLDGTICVAALKNKINIQEQFTNYLDGDAKLLTTQCIVKEVEKLGNNAPGVLFVLRNFGQHCCGHDKSSVPASNCILDMVRGKNSSRYIIATQDRELQQKCRKITGVPLLYFHLKVPVLEAPSSLTQSTINYKSLNDFQIKEFEKKKLSKLSLEADDVKPIQRKRKLKGGPNPLSCKKKQKKDQSDVIKKSEVKAKKKKSRKRNRSNLLKKIKNEVKATLQV